MDVLESQVEALIFNYLSFGFLTTVHTFWTLIAVLTAAVSFWRIRAIGSILSPQKSDDSPSSSSSSSSSSFHHHDLKFNGFDSPAAPLEEEEDEDEKKALEICCSCSFESYSTSTFVSAIAIDGNVKSKLTVYYNDEDNSNGYTNDEDDQEEDVNLATDLTEEEKIVQVYGRDWEMEGMLMMRRRIEDFGWYRCQDLSSLNGSVIKLWEEGRRSTTTTLDGGVGKVW